VCVFKLNLVDWSVLRTLIMDEFSNQLIEAPEDEDIDDLNDETFGDSGNICEYTFSYLKNEALP
jgi:hypothetical protein